MFFSSMIFFIHGPPKNTKKVTARRRHTVTWKSSTKHPWAGKRRVENQGMRVYIAKKLTFTTLIDHFTSLDAESSLVLSDQLIKLELLTQSIRQQKLPPHAVRFAAFDPAVRMALAVARGAAAVASCFGKTLGIIPIETIHCSKICTSCQSLFDKNRTCRPYLH